MPEIIIKYFRSSRLYHWPAIILNTLLSALILDLREAVGIILGIQISCLASFAFVMNDYLDVEIDEYNKIDRLNGINREKRNYLFAFAFSYLIIAFLLCNYMNYKFIGGLVFLTALLVIYNLALKKFLFIGNLVAAISIMSTMWIPMLYSGLNSIPSLYVLILLCCLTYHFSRELILDSNDVIGDNIIRRQTYPIIFGTRNSLYLGTLLIFISLILLYIFSFSLFAQKYYFLAIISIFIVSTILFINVKSAITININSGKLKGIDLFVRNSRISMILFTLLLATYLMSSFNQ